MLYLKNALLICISFFALCQLSANTDTRKWQLQDGAEFTAELVSYTPETGDVWMNFNWLFEQEDFIEE